MREDGRFEWVFVFLSFTGNRGKNLVDLRALVLTIRKNLYRFITRNSYSTFESIFRHRNDARFTTLHKKTARKSNEETSGERCAFYVLIHLFTVLRSGLRNS